MMGTIIICLSPLPRAAGFTLAAQKRAPGATHPVKDAHSRSSTHPAAYRCNSSFACHKSFDESTLGSKELDGVFEKFLLPKLRQPVREPVQLSCGNSLKCGLLEHAYYVEKQHIETPHGCQLVARVQPALATSNRFNNNKQCSMHAVVVACIFLGP